MISYNKTCVCQLPNESLKVFKTSNRDDRIKICDVWCAWIQFTYIVIYKQINFIKLNLAKFTYIVIYKQINFIKYNMFKCMTWFMTKLWSWFYTQNQGWYLLILLEFLVQISNFSVRLGWLLDMFCHPIFTICNLFEFFTNKWVQVDI